MSIPRIQDILQNLNLPDIKLPDLKAPELNSLFRKETGVKTAEPKAAIKKPASAIQVLGLHEQGHSYQFYEVQPREKRAKLSFFSES